MTTFYTGTTNLDGTGSAENLSASFDDLGNLIGGDYTNYKQGLDFDSTDGTILGVNGTGNLDMAVKNYGIVLSNQGDWNAFGYKEAKIVTALDSNDTHELVVVDNFVDVDIDVASELGQQVNIEITDAKRGHIDTGSGDDFISISVFSTGASSTGWANTFYINTGDGGDRITITAADVAPSGAWVMRGSNTGTQYTEYVIDAGSGNDYVNVSGLVAAYDEELRSIDGGEGFDIAVVSDMTNLEMTGFEVICGTVGESELSYDALFDIVENDVYHGEHDFALLLNNIEVSDAMMGHPEMVTRWLTSEEVTYLSELQEHEGCDIPVSSHDISNQYAMVTFVDDVDGDGFYELSEEFSFITNDSDIIDGLIA